MWRLGVVRSRIIGICFLNYQTKFHHDNNYGSNQTKSDWSENVLISAWFLQPPLSSHHLNQPNPLNPFLLSNNHYRWFQWKPQCSDIKYLGLNVIWQRLSFLLFINATNQFFFYLIHPKKFLLEGNKCIISGESTHLRISGFKSILQIKLEDKISTAVIDIIWSK